MTKQAEGMIRYLIHNAMERAMIAGADLVRNEASKPPLVAKMMETLENDTFTYILAAIENGHDYDSDGIDQGGLS